MIGSAFLYTLGGILYALTFALRNLDDVLVSPTITNAIVQVNTWAATLYAFFPIEVVLICGGILLLWEKWWMIYVGIRWVYQKIPGLH